ncbi:pyridine nucleotide-disulfide oxidoreductase [Streptomyces sp. T12]|uniref:FAD-dependent oxidoreductase n=1 Tax=Streptomyces sp. T12 TaxID=477697 RepID=UPI0011AD1560|nr:FAD-dependent oxidoreductase [Streptomyces sp. T12]TWD12923.1 pyridine nucleotide-disulfide oxidoreductase [Streptomyces sp. T12]
MEHIDVAVIGGGQSGLATAHALLHRGLRPVVLEASDRTAGSWPHYYDSLTLFSPARYSSLPGMSFPGADRDRYPHRDEVVAYLTAYASRLDADTRTNCRVTTVRRTGGAFEVDLEGGDRLSARAVVAASGTFGRPHRPALPCVAWAGTRTAWPGAWPPTSPAGDGPPCTGSTCVNIDVCRMRRSCRCSSPPTVRAWRRAARR